MERAAVSYVLLGKSLRKCRRSIKPPYSQQDLAACILSQPVCQGIFPHSIQGPTDLVPVIEDLEAHGRWALSLPLLEKFLEAAVNCLTPDCRPDLLTEFAAIILDTIIAELDPSYASFIGSYLPEQSNPPENGSEDDDDDDDDHDKGND
jgi:hypothetical protein